MYGAVIRTHFWQVALRFSSLSAEKSKIFGGPGNPPVRGSMGVLGSTELRSSGRPSSSTAELENASRTLSAERTVLLQESITASSIFAKWGSPVNTLAPSFLAAERTKASAKPKLECFDFTLACRRPASLESFSLSANIFELVVIALQAASVSFSLLRTFEIISASDTTCVRL